MAEEEVVKADGIHRLTYRASAEFIISSTPTASTPTPSIFTPEWAFGDLCEALVPVYPTFGLFVGRRDPLFARRLNMAINHLATPLGKKINRSGPLTTTIIILRRG